MVRKLMVVGILLGIPPLAIAWLLYRMIQEFDNAIDFDEYDWWDEVFDGYEWDDEWVAHNDPV